MKSICQFRIISYAVFACRLVTFSGQANAQAAVPVGPVGQAKVKIDAITAPRNESLRNEIQRAIDRGLTWLSANQNSNGWWQTADHPAVTALALTAFNAA